MYLIRDIYDFLEILNDILIEMKYDDSSLVNIKDYKKKYNELEYNKYTIPSNNINKVILFFKKFGNFYFLPCL